jgi:hypothetical protein
MKETGRGWRASEVNRRQHARAFAVTARYALPFCWRYDARAGALRSKGTQRPWPNTVAADGHAVTLRSPLVRFVAEPGRQTAQAIQVCIIDRTKSRVTRTKMSKEGTAVALNPTEYKIVAARRARG